MWMERLVEGVLRVDTAIGPRYIRPNFKDRVRLLWTFRNFVSLPQQVLTANEQRFIDRLCREQGFMALQSAADLPLIGRVERRVRISGDLISVRKPAASSKTALAEDSREVASA